MEMDEITYYIGMRSGGSKIVPLCTAMKRSQENEEYSNNNNEQP